MPFQLEFGTKPADNPSSSIKGQKPYPPSLSGHFELTKHMVKEEDTSESSLFLSKSKLPILLTKSPFSSSSSPSQLHRLRISSSSSSSFVCRATSNGGISQAQAVRHGHDGRADGLFHGAAVRRGRGARPQPHLKRPRPVDRRRGPSLGGCPRLWLSLLLSYVLTFFAVIYLLILPFRFDRCCCCCCVCAHWWKGESAVFVWPTVCEWWTALYHFHAAYHNVIHSFYCNCRKQKRTLLCMLITNMILTSDLFLSKVGTWMTIVANLNKLYKLHGDANISSIWTAAAAAAALEHIVSLCARRCIHCNEKKSKLWELESVRLSMALSHGLSIMTWSHQCCSSWASFLLQLLHPYSKTNIGAVDDPNDSITNTTKWWHSLVQSRNGVQDDS